MKNANDQAYVAIGKVGATYGVRGWLRVHAYTEFDTHIFKYVPWYLSTANNSWDIVKIEAGRPHTNGLIVKLAGFDTPETARLLTGKTIAVPRSQLPPLKQNEFYWTDLIGLTVINKNDAIVGKVIYLMETGANDVLVVKGSKEYAIPYLPGTVIHYVDLAKQEIHIDWELV